MGILATEEEAKTKWCPFARSMVTLDVSGNPFHGFAINRNQNGEAVGACVGSHCMAWQWTNQLGENDRLKGFCSLAGNRS